jgi:mono/diheme cytochrome c family protein
VTRAAGRALALAALAAALVAGGAARAQDPAVDYMLQCQGCHLADGAGAPGAVPDLRGRVALLARAPGGREYLVRVPGVAQAQLSDARLATLLDFVVRRFGPADAAAAVAPFTPAEVAEWRAHPYADPSRARATLLRQLAEGR